MDMAYESLTPEQKKAVNAALAEQDRALAERVKDALLTKQDSRLNLEGKIHADRVYWELRRQQAEAREFLAERTESLSMAELRSAMLITNTCPDCGSTDTVLDSPKTRRCVDCECKYWRESDGGIGKASGRLNRQLAAMTADAAGDL
jgi:ribosomal protein S27E